MSVIHVATYPSDDIEGVWIGHVLDIDVVSQGSSPSEAKRAAISAFRLCRRWDNEAAYKDLPERRRASASDWARPHEVVEVP